MKYQIILLIIVASMVAYFLLTKPNGVEYVDVPIVGAGVVCELEQRNADACIEIYQPVCGKVNVQCITSPCPPLSETFSNSCFACSNSFVESYTEGECALQKI